MAIGDQEPEEYLTLDDATYLYGVSRSTVFRLIRAGELPSYKQPGDRRTKFRRDELDRVMRPRRRPEARA